MGQAAVAMWWDVATEHRAEFEDWHSHEHFPERIGIPGFGRASRWASADGGEGFFVLYELDAYETLTSPHYLARLNAPTPWSTQMMPLHRNMVRSQCRVLESHGGAIGACMVTKRFSPSPSYADEAHDRLCAALPRFATRAGVTGIHLLRTQTPRSALTLEQEIRGGADAVADWIILISGYEAAALTGASEELDALLFVDGLGLDSRVTSMYRLRYSMVSENR